MRGPDGHSRGLLAARPPATHGAASLTGLQPLALTRPRDGWLYVPASYDAARPAPMAVLLHGAGGQAQHGIGLLQGLADEAGLILLATDSRAQTWDVIMGGYGPDVAFLDEALAQTFGRYAVDPARLAIGGFSDGASYALSLGLTNGDLWSHILAFSPGFMAPAAQRGEPRIFVSHGTRDAVLPIERCSRRLVPVLQQAGYEVRYREFDGPHTVPAAMAEEAVRWFCDTPRVTSDK